MTRKHHTDEIASTQQQGTEAEDIGSVSHLERLTYRFMSASGVIDWCFALPP